MQAQQSLLPLLKVRMLFNNICLWREGRQFTELKSWDERYILNSERQSTHFLSYVELDFKCYICICILMGNDTGKMVVSRRKG